MSTYLFDRPLFKIDDEDLTIFYEEHFTPVLIPDDLKNGLVIGDHKLKIFRFSDGSFEYTLEKDQILDGEYLLTYPDGKKKIHSFYKAGQLHGPSRVYSPEEKKLVETWFIEGERNGQCLSFYNSGSPCSTQHFLKNVWHGKQEFWYEDGTLKTSMDYEQGEINGKITLYYPNGKLKRELTFTQGIFVT